MMMNHDSEPTAVADRRLHAFFRREMPHPWPALQLPATTPRRQPLRRSRLALAASMLILVGGVGMTAYVGGDANMQPQPLPKDVLPPTASKPSKNQKAIAPPMLAPQLPKR